MREFLDLLEKDGQLKHLDVPFDGRRDSNELQALMNYVCAKDGPALMLNNVNGINGEGQCRLGATTHRRTPGNKTHGEN